MLLLNQADLPLNRRNQLAGFGDVQSVVTGDCRPVFFHQAAKSPVVQINVGQHAHRVGHAGTGGQRTGGCFGHRQTVSADNRRNDNIGFVAGNSAQTMVVNHNSLIVPVKDVVADQSFRQSQNFRRTHE